MTICFRQAKDATDEERQRIMKHIAEKGSQLGEEGKELLEGVRDTFKDEGAKKAAGDMVDKFQERIKKARESSSGFSRRKRAADLSDEQKAELDKTCDALETARDNVKETLKGANEVEAKMEELKAGVEVR